MKTAVFSAHKFEREYLLAANGNRHELRLLDAHLDLDTAVLAEGCDAVSIFVSDNAAATVLEKLHKLGVKALALRSAGFNHVDIAKAHALGIKVARVPDYSPYAVAEHAAGLILALNRKLIRSHNRVMDRNFSLDGLVGFDLHGKTAGVIGTGKIGKVMVKILAGFGCRILAFDQQPDAALTKQYGIQYTDCETLCRQSDIVTLHIPLTKNSRYIIDAHCISQMKKGVMLINTSRGGLVNTKAVIDALKTGKIGYFGMDVYEEEEGLFFEDHSEEILQDDVLARLMTFPNVIITSHQAFLTDTALQNIARETIANLDCFEKEIPSANEIKTVS